MGDACGKYLNNVVEKNHRPVKQRIRPMLGFNRFDTAAITISGIELEERCSSKSASCRSTPPQLPNSGQCSHPDRD